MAGTYAMATSWLGCLNRLSAMNSECQSTRMRKKKMPGYNYDFWVKESTVVDLAYLQRCIEGGIG